MPEEKGQDDLSVSDEAEKTAAAERERLFQARSAGASERSAIGARFVETMTRGFGFDPGTVPEEVADSFHALRDQLANAEPLPFESTRPPPTAE